jgi:hypothetical protein
VLLTAVEADSAVVVAAPEEAGVEVRAYHDRELLKEQEEVVGGLDE